jgi:CBS domain-containing protein
VRELREAESGSQILRSYRVGESSVPTQRPKVILEEGGTEVSMPSVMGSLAGEVQAASRVRVAEVMTRAVRVVHPETRIDDVVRMLAEEGISGVPVVDPLHRPIGIVSKTDLIWRDYEQLEDAEDELYSRFRGWSGLPGGDTSATVADLLRGDPLTIREDVFLLDAVELMASRAIHRLPVVDEHGRLSGIVSSLDVLAWLAREAGRPVPRKLSRAR